MSKSIAKKIGSTAIEALTREKSCADFIPYSHHVTDEIISTKEGDYLSVWRIEGKSHQSASHEELMRWVIELNNTLKSMDGDGVSFWSHTVRRKVQEYPSHEYENEFCRTLDKKYKKGFDSYSLMVNDLYLTVVVKRINNKTLSFFSKYEKQSKEDKLIEQKDRVERLDEINRQIKGAMGKYEPSLLGVYDRNGHSYSSALEFLGLLVNGKRRQVPVCKQLFSDYLGSKRIIFGSHGSIGELRDPVERTYFGMLEIKEYDDASEAGHLNTLFETDYEFILTNSFSTMGKADAVQALKNQKKFLEDANDVAESQIEEIYGALDNLVSGHFSMGEHHCTLTVFGDSIAKLKKDMADATTKLLNVGIKPTYIDLALEAGYWAQMPGNWKYRPRPSPITSLNFLSLSSFHNFLSGKPTGNPWGEAVTIFKTVSGTPLYFNFHASSKNDDAYDKRLLGNTMIIGQSGTGKSVLLSFLMAQSQRFKPRIVAFDKDRGLEVTIRAIGGKYLPLKNEEKSGFNPFQMENTPSNRAFLKALVAKLVGSDGAPVTHDDTVEIDNAVEDVMGNVFDESTRRLSLMMQFLPDPVRSNGNTRPSVSERLIKWKDGQANGWLFDNTEDELNLDSHQLYGFDITEFLENEETRAPLMMYLLHRTESMLDGSRFMYMIDEFWKPLEDEYFEDLAKNKQKTIRKQNGIFVFATQEPSDALESKIAKTLIQQCATYIFLPNPKADASDYINGFKLTEREFEIVQGLGEFSRKFLIKQGDNAAIATLDLAGFDDELSVLSGTTDNAEIAEELVREYGEDPNIWLDLYIKQVRGGNHEN